MSEGKDEMSQGHDPVRQANYLIQILAQEKRSLGLFVSGGCQMAIKLLVSGSETPLIPGIEGITKVIHDRLITSPDKELYEKVCSHFATDHRNEPSVEDLLTHIRALRQVAGNDSVRGLRAGELEALDREICEIIVGVVDKSLPANDTPYHRVAAGIGAVPRSQPVEIFTPNYDLLMEQALEENRIPYFDGFVGSHRAFFDPYAMEEDALPPRWARLWKLHGSINWRQDQNGVVSRGERASASERRVIHPSHLKYEESRQMPYLAMIDRLRSFLKRPSSALVICGYSFRDDHLNANLVQGVQGNPTAVIFALLYGKLASYGAAVKLATSRANFSLLAEDGAVIGTKHASWMSKEGEEIGSPSPAVEWVAKDSAAADIRQARFTLGDFARFGYFVGELIGIEGGKEE